jgi:hypothetical protein
VVSFNLAAASGGDIEVTDFSPTVKVDEDDGGTYATGTEGSTDSTSRITSCSLYDGSDLVSGPESIASTSTGKINFADFSYWVEAGQTQTLNVYCNLANVNPGTADLFAWTMIAATDMTALDEEGDSATVTGTNINFASSTPTMIIRVTNSGSLTETAASDTPNADLTGSSGNSVSKFRFDAASEAFVVDRLTVTEEQGETDTGTTDSNVYANNVSLVSLSYPDSTGATQTVSGALTGNEVTFNSLTFYVPKDDHAELTVKVSVPTTDRSGGSATSNERIRMGLSRDTSALDQIRAVGAGSGQTLNDSNIAVATATSSMSKFVVRETKPTISLSSSSPSGAKTPGNQETLRFNVAASSNEDVVLDNIIFTFSASDNAASDWNQCNTGVADGTKIYDDGRDFKFYNLTEDSSASTALAGTYSILKSTGLACDASNADVAFVKLALTTAETVPAGTTTVYSLWFNSDSASSLNDDSVQIGLAADPITSTYQALTTPRTATGSDLVSAGDGLGSTLTLNSARVDGQNSSLLVGDVLIAGSSSERLLLVALPTTTTVTVVRGYLGTTPADINSGSSVTRLPGALLWQDDGSTSVSSAVQEYYGAYLVDNLPITGNSLSF